MELVIRPSGVWDSRAPFHNYLHAHRELQQIFNAISLTVIRVTDEASIAGDMPLKKFLRVEKLGDDAYRAWKGFRDTATDVGQTAAELPRVLATSEAAMVEYTLLKYASLFETYLQCWTLNYLLAKLETDIEWSPAERRLALRFAPIHQERTLPTVPQIIQAVPEIHTWLSRLPHIRNHPHTGVPVHAPVAPLLTALNTILFWRAFRNLVIHRGGIVSAGFFNRNQTFFQEFARWFKYVRRLKIGARVEMTRGLFVTVSVTHYLAALYLSDRLEEVSMGRRGHPNAPGPKLPWIHPLTPVPKLLLEGDHGRSLEWTVNPEFRRAVTTELNG